jgi:hypothetical protein
MEQRRVDAFLQLSRLERGIRRFLEKELSRTDGPSWPRTLPNDVKKKVVSGGLELTDFPDLKKILGSKWRRLGDSTSGIRKDHLLSLLEALEPIRNDVAHSRDVPPGALAMVQAAYYVAEPILASDSLGDPLPPTVHQRVVLDRLHGALTYFAPIQESELYTLHDLDGYRETRVAIENYERVRFRPGRTEELMNQVRSVALDCVNGMRTALGKQFN